MTNSVGGGGPGRRFYFTGSRGVFSRASAGHKRKSLVKIGEVTRAQRCWLYVPTGNLRRSHPAEKTPDTWALGTRGADRRFGTPPSNSGHLWVPFPGAVRRSLVVLRFAASTHLRGGVFCGCSCPCWTTSRTSGSSCFDTCSRISHRGPCPPALERSPSHKRKSLVKIGEVTRAQRCWLYVPTGNLFDDRRSHPAEKTPDTWALGTRGADRRFGTPPPIPVTYGAPLP